MERATEIRTFKQKCSGVIVETLYWENSGERFSHIQLLKDVHTKSRIQLYSTHWSNQTNKHMRNRKPDQMK